MKLYRIIRGLHLYTSFVLMVFVLMYFVSGYVILHGKWFGAHPPTKTVREEKVATPVNSDPQELQLDLQNQLGLHGKPMPARKRNDGSWQFTYSRPGDVQQAIIHPDGRVEVTESTQNFAGTLNAFHRLHGYSGGGLYVFWAVLYDLASASMIVFALSGIYLWYKITRRRALGWALLAISFAYAGGTMLYLVYAP